MSSNKKGSTQDYTYDDRAFEDAHDKPSVTVPVVRATDAALAGYGRIVRHYDLEEIIRVTWPKTSGWRDIATGSGHHQPALEGDFRLHWDKDVIFADNTEASLYFATGRLDKSRNHVLVRYANNHPDGGQIFFPPAGGHPYVMMLAPADVGDDVRPQHFRAFYFEDGVGFQIAPGVWHNSPFFGPPASGSSEQMVFKNKQSSVFATVNVDVVKEFGVYLKVPLQLSDS